MDLTQITLNTCYPGKIVSFDPATQLASVEIARELYYADYESLYTEYDNPQLIDVPVHFPQCGGYSLTFPIKVGDNCLIFYSQRGHSHWLYKDANKIGKFSTGIPKAEYFRAHNINDALCIVGFNPVPRAIPNFSSTDVELRDTSRGQRITLKPSGVIEVLSQTELDVTTPTVKVVASSLVEVTAPNTNIIGNLHVTGTITSDTSVHGPEVFANNIAMSVHTHNHGVPPDA